MKTKLILLMLIIIFLSCQLYAEQEGLQLGQTQYFSDSGEFNISVSAGKSSITVTLPTMDVHQFVVYRSTEKDGAYSKVQVTKKSTFVDTKIQKGITYYYVAVALKKVKNDWEKIPSNKASTLIEVEITVPITEVNVSFNSTPNGAIVIINNENIGTTPVSKKFKFGTYQLTIQKDGYRTYKDFNFEVNYNKNMNVNVTLEKITASLSISTTPPDASIKLNSSVVGKSPVRKDGLLFGNYSIQATLSGYKPVSKVVIINSETPSPVHITFEKEIFRGNVNIDSTPRAASIYIDNIKYGTTPYLVKNIQAGIHSLRLVKSEYNEVLKDIEVEADKTKDYTFPLVKENGLISIKTFPDSADILLNDKLIGKTPIASQLVDIGTYNLSIKKEDHSEYREVIKINVGDHLQRDIILSLNKATLSINTYPDKAIIRILGMNYGLTPFISDSIQPGKIKIEITKTGFKNISEDIDLSPGAVEQLSYNLEPIVEAQPVVIKKGTLTVITRPPDASIYINNKLQNVTPGIITLDPGNYGVTIKKQNYQDWTGNVIIESEEAEEINIDLLAKETYLSLNSTPDGAQVQLNNISYGNTPLRFKIGAGDYVVNLTKSGYNPYSTRLQITGTEQEVNRTYSLQKEVKKYSFSSTPGSAEVMMNNRIVGVTPFELVDLTDGSYNITFRKTGYRTWEKQISFSGGYPNNITATLDALKGDLIVLSTPTPCDLYLDNKKMGTTGSTIKNIPAGYHDISLKKYGYHDFNDKIQIMDSKLSSYTFNLIEKPKGNLRVTSTPSDANVYLNSSLKGATPLFLEKIPEDKYNLRIKKSGYRSFYSTVSVPGNRTEYVNAQLVKGSDCCLGNSLLTKPAFWYITSALCLVGSGWSWYEEERALDRGDNKRRHQLHELRNGLAYGSGACLLIGITFHLAK